MTDPLAVHAVAEGILLPDDLTAHPTRPVVAWTLHGDHGRRRLMLLDLDDPAGAVDAGLPDELDVALLRWVEDDLIVAAVRDDERELTDVAGIRVDLTALPPTASVVWRHRLAGAVEDILPGGDAHLVLIAEPGAERDGSHLGTRVGPIGDPLVDRADVARRRLVLVEPTGHRREVTAGGLNVWSADWDGEGLAVAVVSDDPRQAGFYSPRLARLDLDADTVTDVYSTAWQLAQPRLSPDGRTALVVEGLSIVSGRVLAVDLATAVVSAWDDVDDVTDLGWLDDDCVWVAGWEGTGSFVAVGDRGGRLTSRWSAPVSLRGADWQPSVVPVTGRGLVGVAESDDHGPELISLEPGVTGHTRLTCVNDAFLGLAQGVRRSAVSWESTDGLEIHGLLLCPAETSGPVPLVVVAHGGPTWLWSHALSPAESYNVVLPIVRAGGAVLLPNPRGSSGRGQEFARGVVGTVGGRDLDDVLSGIEHLTRSGLADPDRIGMLGLSYGGYLTAMAATSLSPVRAAAVLSGVTDWLSFRVSSNLGGTYDRLYLDGLDPATPYGREALAAISPVYLATPDATPTLILHSRDDRTTPIGQGEMLHRALRHAGAVTELVTYPDEGHELVDPAHRRDAAERVLSWLTVHGVLA